MVATAYVLRLGSDCSTSSNFTSDPRRAKPDRLIVTLLSGEADI
jgi:hypothetical protein